MAEGLSSLLFAIGVFVSTNVDDIVLLAAFFADRRLHRWAIVLGQFLGIGTLTAVSAAAGLLVFRIPPEWTSLLGLAPAALGLRKLWVLRSADADGTDRSADTGELKAEARLHSQALAVASVTIANGGDNFGIYIPVLANNPSAIVLFAIVFAVMTALWCLAGFLLVRSPMVGKVIQRWGHIILPFVLIAIGLHILWGARPLLF